AVAHARANLVEEAGGIAVPSDLAKLVAELGSPAERIERAAVLLARGEEKRPRRDGEPRDKGVQPVGRRLRERDAGRAGGLVDRRRDVGGHAVMMPRIASPAVKSAARPRATD